MRRSKKKGVMYISKKYKPRNQFRYNNSKEAAGHPHYIFGEREDKYVSLGLTTHPKKGMKVYKLEKSLKPKTKKKQQYLQRKVFVSPKDEYGKKRLKGWKFHAADLPLIRHIKKSFKKGKEI